MFKRTLLVLVALLTVSVVSVSTAGARDNKPGSDLKADDQIVCMYSFTEDQDVIAVSWGTIKEPVEVSVYYFLLDESKGEVISEPKLAGKTKDSSLKFESSSVGKVEISYKDNEGSRNSLNCEFVDDLPEDEPDLGAKADSNLSCIYSFTEEAGVVAVSWNPIKNTELVKIYTYADHSPKKLSEIKYIGKTEGTSFKFKEPSVSIVGIAYLGDNGLMSGLNPCEFVDDVPENSKTVPTKPAPGDSVTWPTNNEKPAKAVNGSPKYTG